jgi:hypothetical protein
MIIVSYLVYGPRIAIGNGDLIGSEERGISYRFARPLGEKRDESWFIKVLWSFYIRLVG